jgi:hypothetical protein
MRRGRRKTRQVKTRPQAGADIVLYAKWLGRTHE